MQNKVRHLARMKKTDRKFQKKLDALSNLKLKYRTIEKLENSALDDIKQNFRIIQNHATINSFPITKKIRSILTRADQIQKDLNKNLYWQDGQLIWVTSKLSQYIPEMLKEHSAGRTGYTNISKAAKH
jgi:hypothetical protein